MWVRIPRLLVALVLLGACGSGTEAGDGKGSQATGGSQAGSSGSGGAGNGGAGFGGRAGAGGAMDSGGAGNGNTGGAADGGAAGSAGRAGAAGSGAGGRPPWDDLTPCVDHADCLATERCLGPSGGRCVPVASSCASDAWMQGCSSCRSSVSDTCPCLDWAFYCPPNTTDRNFYPQCSDNGSYLFCFYFG